MLTADLFTEWKSYFFPDDGHLDAAWTKKNDETYFGYKNHINVDNKHKLIRNFAITDASVHDSQKANDILDEKNEKDLWGGIALKIRSKP